ncbi:MAG: hypothetical protein AAF922_05145 [Pseudomonadota bacterium]
MRLVLAFLVLVGIAFGSDTVSASVLNATQIRLLDLEDTHQSAAWSRETDFSNERVRQGAWNSTIPFLATLKPRSRFDAARAVALSKDIAGSFIKQSAYPARVLWGGLITQITAFKDETGEDQNLFAQAFRAQDVIASLAKRAHERKVRHFLIHDWPGPGRIASSGSSAGSHALAASQINYVTPSSAPSTFDDGSATIILASVESPDIQSDAPPAPSEASSGFGPPGCELATLSDPDCPEGPETLGRMPYATALSPNGTPLAVSFSASSSPRTPSLLSPRSIGNSFSSSGSGSGSGSGTGEQVGEEDVGTIIDNVGDDTDVPFFPPMDTDGDSYGDRDQDIILTGPSAVPIPGSLALILVGLTSLAFMRRQKTLSPKL